MLKREKYENGLMTVRFTGPDLDARGVSIYDLSSTLLAVQRMIHKGHLAMTGELKKGAFPRKAERERLSLYIGERKRESDAFALLPLLADAETYAFAKNVVDYVSAGLRHYHNGDVVKTIAQEHDDNRKEFLGSIHSDITDVVHRIGAAGGLDAIELGAPALNEPMVALFDEDRKQYVAKLASEYYLGRRQTIRGNVYRFYPNAQIVTIRRAGGRKVNVYLSDADFSTIRYDLKGDPLIEFTGRPRHKFRIESLAITDFEAEQIDVVEKD